MVGWLVGWFSRVFLCCFGFIEEYKLGGGLVVAWQLCFEKRVLVHSIAEIALESVPRIITAAAERGNNKLLLSFAVVLA